MAGKAIKKGGPALRSMVSGAASGVTGPRKTNEPWRKLGAMDEILKYEPVGANINPKKTASVGARARGL